MRVTTDDARCLRKAGLCTFATESNARAGTAHRKVGRKALSERHSRRSDSEEVWELCTKRRGTLRMFARKVGALTEVD